jgi:hypothetical protein
LVCEKGKKEGMSKAQRLLAAVALPLFVAACGGDGSRLMEPRAAPSQREPRVLALATVFQFHELIRYADAVFFGTDPSGCVSTVVEVFASKGPLTGDLASRPRITSFAIVDVSQFDICTNTEVRHVLTEIPQGVELHVADLNRATLELTFTGVDDVSGAEVTVTLSATWIGFGERSRSRLRFREKTPELIRIAGENGAERQATTSAILAVDGESIELEEPGTPGLLGWVNRGSLTVEH